MAPADDIKYLVVDLREFGWGIRTVSVLKGLPEGGQPGPDSVGSEEIRDDSIQMEDLSGGVKDKMMTDEDRVTQQDIEEFDV